MMDLANILKDFAESQGIDVQEVYKFLNKFHNPQTLGDLMKTPNDMLKHFRYTTDIQDPLKQYIRGYEPSRREVITLEDIAEGILDHMYYYENRLAEGDITQETHDKEIEKYRALERQMVEIKFGSVRWDW